MRRPARGSGSARAAAGIDVGSSGLTTYCHTVGICLTIPEVNLSEPVVTFAGHAALTTALTTFGGPALVPGPLHLYALRPVAGTASAVES